MLDPRWSRPGAAGGDRRRPRGRLIERLDRRGKYLIVALEDDVHLVMHLRMTGNLLLADQEPPHTRVLFDARRRPAPALRGRAPLRDRRRAARERRAGRLLRVAPGRGAPGPRLHRRGPAGPGARARQPVKAFLLNQERIAGVGNIYADEALFRARIHPLPAGGHPEAGADRGAPRRRGGDAQPGSTRRAPRSTTSATSTAPRAGSRTASWCTRGRASPAPRGGTIRKMRAAGRGTYVCERCQPSASARQAAPAVRPPSASASSSSSILRGRPPPARGSRPPSAGPPASAGTSSAR